MATAASSNAMPRIGRSGARAAAPIAIVGLPYPRGGYSRRQVLSRLAIEPGTPGALRRGHDAGRQSEGETASSLGRARPAPASLAAVAAADRARPVARASLVAGHLPLRAAARDATDAGPAGPGLRAAQGLGLARRDDAGLAARG